MRKRSPEVPISALYIVLGIAGGFFLSLIFAASSSDLLSYIGKAGLGLYAIGTVLYVAFGDALDAWDNERHVEAHPEHVYSEDIGRTVTAMNDFTIASSSSSGKVSLGGESWDAICEGDQAPRKGDRLTIKQRDGLKLIVSAIEE